jgi:hypothetical protein
MNINIYIYMYIHIISDAGGLNAIEDLQNHENQNIYI